MIHKQGACRYTDSLKSCRVMLPVVSKAANILALSEASCSDTFSLHSLPQMASLSAVFFRPVIYCNVLIGVYLFAAVSHPKSVSDEQPGR